MEVKISVSSPWTNILKNDSIVMVFFPFIGFGVIILLILIVVCYQLSTKEVLVVYLLDSSLLHRFD